MTPEQLDVEAQASYGQTYHRLPVLDSAEWRAFRVGFECGHTFAMRRNVPVSDNSLASIAKSLDYIAQWCQENWVIGRKI
jgi:hypothetical protein